MGLREYRKKRRFDVTPERSGEHTPSNKPASNLIYVVQKHKARQLHYDFRLAWGGVLRSWAIPKGPSLDPSVKRLAVETEDHPFDYSSFEGVIPEGQYGGGTVMVWDRGTWTPDDPEVDSALRRGELKFTLHGKKLKGSWLLIRTRGYAQSPAQRTWLLIKHRDSYASTKEVTEEEPPSVLSHRLLADITKDLGDRKLRRRTTSAKRRP